MMGLYLVAVVITWSGLTIWGGVRLSRWNSTSNEKNKIWRKSLSIIVVFAWFGASFWFGGGRIFYYDWRVRQLCSIDGGVKVYETAPLKPEILIGTGRVNLRLDRLWKSDGRVLRRMEDRKYYWKETFSSS